MRQGGAANNWAYGYLDAKNKVVAEQAIRESSETSRKYGSFVRLQHSISVQPEAPARG